MIVIFLDVDGVLNSINHLVEIYNKTKRPHSGYEYPFDEKCINNLKLLTKLTNAKIVISSSWRKNQDGRETLLKVLKEHSLAHLVIGWTPDLGGPREEEIKEYLKTTDKNIEKFVILDDDSADMGDLKPYLVKTNTQTGLIYEDVLKALEIFNNLPIYQNKIKEKTLKIY